MDREQPYVQNILTEVSQNMHGSLCSIMFTWHKNNSRTGTEISNITRPSLHACASHHIDHKNTWHTPLERWHGIDQNTCRHQPHRMHTSIMAIMTNEHVITVSAG